MWKDIGSILVLFGAAVLVGLVCIWWFRRRRWPRGESGLILREGDPYASFEDCTFEGVPAAEQMIDEEKNGQAPAP